MPQTLDLDTLTLCSCGCGAPTSGRFASGHNRRVSFNPTGRYEVEPTGCWRWLGSFTKKGYGRASVRGIHTGAHRAVYEALVGPIPDGLMLDHLCRNRACVNPSHLEPVTAAVNRQRQSNVRLNPEAAAAIRLSGRPQWLEARFHGVARQTIGDVRSGKHWSSPLIDARAK